MPGLTQDQLTELDNSPHLHDRTAALIARALHGKPPGTAVASNAVLAFQLGISGVTANKAKQKLAALGFLAAPAGRALYQIAPGGPAGAQGDS